MNVLERIEINSRNHVVTVLYFFIGDVKTLESKSKVKQLRLFMN